MEGNYPENGRGLAMNGAEVVYRAPLPGTLTQNDWIDGWVAGRHGALHVYGPSGQTPSLGTNNLVEKVREAYKWDYESRLGVIPSGGSAMVAHEFDYRQENVAA